MDEAHEVLDGIDHRAVHYLVQLVAEALREIPSAGPDLAERRQGRVGDRPAACLGAIAVDAVEQDGDAVGFDPDEHVARTGHPASHLLGDAQRLRRRQADRPGALDHGPDIDQLHVTGGQAACPLALPGHRLAQSIADAHARRRGRRRRAAALHRGRSRHRPLRGTATAPGDRRGRQCNGNQQRHRPEPDHRLSSSPASLPPPRL